MSFDLGEAVLERRLGIHAVQVVELDHVGVQAAQALFDLGPKDLRLAPSRSPEPTLGGDQAAAGHSRHRLADRLLAVAARVEVRAVDHLHARLNRGFDEVDVGACVRKAIGSQAYARDLSVTELHCRIHLFAILWGWSNASAW